MVDRSEDGRAVRTLTAPPLELDIVEGRLWNDGAPVHLGRKAFALLRMLMERPGRLLTKDELIETVWEGRAVSDAVLTTAMKELRKALDDPARSPVFIETVHGRGYRFLLELEASAPDAASPSQSAGASEALAENGDNLDAAGPRSSFLLWWAAAAAVLLVGAIAYSTLTRSERGAEGTAAISRARTEASVTAPHPKSIAVLPFLDLSPEGDHQWFVDGLTEELISSLAGAPDLRVAARTSAFQFRGQDVDVQRAARDLGVAHALEGSVRRSGDRIRVTAQLIRASDGFHLWSQNYDRAYDDVITIQEDIAFQIATAMRTVMDPQKLQQMVETGTRSVEAYEAYLRGLSLISQHWESGRTQFTREAHDAFEIARVLDPNFAAAHWQAAQFWYMRSTMIGYGGPDSDLSRADIAMLFEDRAAAAIATTRDEAMGLKYAAAQATTQLQFKEAHRLLDAYLSERPRDRDAWVMMSNASFYIGDLEGARRAASSLGVLAREEDISFNRSISSFVFARNIPRALEQARIALDRAPNNAIVQYQAHRAFLWAGDVEMARRPFESVQAGSLPRGNKLIASVRQACAEGRLDDALAYANEVLSSEESDSMKWQIAKVLGRNEYARDLLLPYDSPEHLITLMQWMIYPYFDANEFPEFRAWLDRADIVPLAPIEIPFACAADGSPDSR